MSTRIDGSLAGQSPADVGTLWTMKRYELVARCALLAWPEGWELRVLVDGKPMLAEWCTCSEEAFSLAERWRLRLAEQAWQQIVPRAVYPGRRQTDL